MFNMDLSVWGNFVKWIIKCCYFFIFVIINKCNLIEFVVFGYYFIMILYMNYWYLFISNFFYLLDLIKN